MFSANQKLLLILAARDLEQAVLRDEEASSILNVIGNLRQELMMAANALTPPRQPWWFLSASPRQQP